MAPQIVKQDKRFRKAIPPSQRLAVTLRFLATGDSYASFSALFRIAQYTISLIVPEVCDAIFSVLKTGYLKVCVCAIVSYFFSKLISACAVSSAEEWTQIANPWNYPNCIGAVDGKHIVMSAPPNTGSTFYNYKGTHSIVLMAIADANYKFLYIEVGCNGRVSDGGVFNKCSFARAMAQNALILPEPKPLPGREMPVPFVLVAADKTRRITLATCALHNFSITRNAPSYVSLTMVDRYEDGNFIPGDWRNEGSVPMLQKKLEKYSNNTLYLLLVNCHGNTLTFD